MADRLMGQTGLKEIAQPGSFPFPNMYYVCVLMYDNIADHVHEICSYLFFVCRYFICIGQQAPSTPITYSEILSL